MVHSSSLTRTFMKTVGNYLFGGFSTSLSDLDAIFCEKGFSNKTSKDCFTKV